MTETPARAPEGSPEAATHTYELRLAGDSLIRVRYEVRGRALGVYAFDLVNIDRASDSGLSLSIAEFVAEAYRAGFNTALGRWPR